MTAVWVNWVMFADMLSKVCADLSMRDSTSDRASPGALPANAAAAIHTLTQRIPPLVAICSRFGEPALWRRERHISPDLLLGIEDRLHSLDLIPVPRPSFN